MHARLADKPRLLFVDDERRVLNSMRAMFRRDYELFLTTRGDEALKIIDEQAIDVLVADQRMPVMTGVELLSAARKRSPGTVRILLTGYSDPDAIEGARTEGQVFRFLNKPCPAEELRAIIAEAVQLSREAARPTPTLVFDGTRTVVRDDEETHEPGELDAVPGDLEVADLKQARESGAPEAGRPTSAPTRLSAPDRSGPAPVGAGTPARGEQDGEQAPPAAEMDDFAAADSDAPDAGAVDAGKSRPLAVATGEVSAARGDRLAHGAAGTDEASAQAADTDGDSSVTRATGREAAGHEERAASARTGDDDTGASADDGATSASDAAAVNAPAIDQLSASAAARDGKAGAGHAADRSPAGAIAPRDKSFPDVGARDAKAAGPADETEDSPEAPPASSAAAAASDSRQISHGADGDAENRKPEISIAEGAGQSATPTADAGGVAPAGTVTPIDGHATDDDYEVDEFADTTTIVMSGDIITVREPGAEAPLSYRAPAPYAPGHFTHEPAAPEGAESESDPGEGAQPKPPPIAAPELVTERVPVVEPQRVPPPQAESSPSATRRLPGWAAKELTRDSSTLLLSVIGVVLAVLGAAWLLLSLRAPELPEMAAPTVVETPVTKPGPALPARHTLAENLELGALALDAGALIAPPGASALAFYLGARAQAPDDPRVVQGLDRLAQRIATRARTQLAEANYSALLTSLDALAAIDAADPRLAGLRTEFGQAIDGQFAAAESAIAANQWETATTLIDALALLPFVAEPRIEGLRDALTAAQQRATEQAAQAASAAAQAAAAPTAETPDAVETQPVEPVAEAPPDLDSLFANATASLGAGRLTAPANDNAMHYLDQVRQVEPDNPLLVAGLRDLANALTERALAHARDRQWVAAEAALEQAASIGVGTVAIEQAREQVLAQRVASESARVLPLSQMERLEFVQPEYPARALRNNKEGWVIVTFTVQPDGSVSDVVAEDTSNFYGRQFAQAAAAAVEGWRFEPRVFLGQPIPQRVRARVNFKLAE